MNNSFNNNNQNDPQDTRNMMIFFIIAAFLYFSYYSFYVSPRNRAVKEQARIAAIQAQTNPVKIEPILERNVVTQDSGRIKINNASLIGSINLKGGRLDDISLKNYDETLNGDTPVSLLSPNQTEFPRYIDYGWTSKNTALSLPNAQTQWSVSSNAPLSAKTPVTLFWNNGQGLKFERIYSMDDNFLITVTQKVTNASNAPITIYPYGLISQQGVPPNFTGRMISHEGLTGFIDDKLFSPSYKSLRKDKGEVVTAKNGWIGITDKYFLTNFIPPQGQDVKYSFKYAGDAKDKNNKGKYQADFVGGAVNIDVGETVRSESHVFTGAKEVITLKGYGETLDVRNFDLAVDFGVLWFLSKPFFFMLHFFGEILNNMGVAIILLTLLIRSAVFPLTNKSYRSFAKMKKFAPEVAEIKEKYGDDKKVLQQKIMEFYQKEGVNPMAGCLPIVLQIPIFFALYKTLFVTIEIRHAPFFGWIKDLSAPDPTSVFNLFGLIPWDPPSFLMIGVWPCIMFLAMMVQKNLNPPPQDPLQRDIARFFPFMMAFILARFPAGLVIYWTCSAVIGATQQIIIMRSMDVPIYLFGQTKPEEKDNIASKDDTDTEIPQDSIDGNASDKSLVDSAVEAPKKPISAPKKKKNHPKKSKKKKK